MTTAPEPTFAETFERLRVARGWSPAEVARRLTDLAGKTVYPAEVGRWRHGKGGISIQNVRLVAELFGVDRTTLERLAGYGDTYVGSVQDTADQEIKALLDAERAETHEELKGVEPQFWPIIIEAGRVARQAAAKVARMAAPQSISDPSSLPNSATANHRGELKRGGDRASGKPKSGGYLLAAAG